MRILPFLAILMIALNVTGCGSDLGSAAAGAGGGFFANDTMRGIQTDLERKEQELIQRYNQAIATGAKQEVLDKLDKQIALTQQGQQGVEIVKEAVGADWSDPKVVSAILGGIGSLAFAVIKGQKLKRLETGVNRFISKSDATVSGQLYDEIARKRAET